MAHVNKHETANRKIQSITKVGLVTNLALSVVKLIVGIVGSSMALVADGVHSISDMVTDLTVLVGVHFGSKQADPKHPYGHGRIETFASMGVGLVLVVVGLGMVYQAGKYITESHEMKPGGAVLFVAVISIPSDEEGGGGHAQCGPLRERLAPSQ